MISRYTRQVMGEIWSLESRFQCMLEVEKAVAQAQGELGILPKDVSQAILKKASFCMEEIARLEEQSHHDVIAFVSNVAEKVGSPYGAYVHFGLTSSDVLDTALSLQVRKAAKQIHKIYDVLMETLLHRMKEQRASLCAGRTHGILAEPTTFGLKLAGHFMEFQRARQGLEEALQSFYKIKLSGPVGTYSGNPVEVEQRVGEILCLSREEVATQVVPRDRHARLILNLGLVACAIERLSVELRHLQRSEVAEVRECFSSGQKGSSAMPHKRNPISAENMSGLARLFRSYTLAAMENIALWHERDMSHSSVERVVFPDAFILMDYVLARMEKLLRGLEVDRERMKTNMMSLGQGQIFSAQLLNRLLEKGWSREKAYQCIQSLSHNLKPTSSLEDAVQSHKELSAILSKEELKELFSGQWHTQLLQKRLEDLLSRV